MYKRITVLVTFLIIFIFPTIISGQEITATKSPSPTDAEETSLDETIKSLKEKIEDKVDQINKSSKKVVKGIITSMSDGAIELTTDTDEIYTVSIDDTITSFFSTSADGQEAIEQSDFEKGNYIIVNGPLIEQQISANSVYLQTPYLVLQGHVTALDKSAFTLDVVTFEKDEYVLDIEDDTTQYLMNSKTLELEKSGFSKFRVGDTIHFVIVKPEAKKKSATAIRTLIIPQEYFVDEDATTPAITETVQ